MSEITIRDYIGLAPEKVITSALRNDAREVSSSAIYEVQNRLGYYTCINTWLLIIKEWSPYSWMYVSMRIEKQGLLSVIGDFASAADSVVRDEPVTDTLVNSIIGDIRRTITSGNLPPLNEEKNIGRDVLATVLFVLRYPKRFSPDGADKLLKESIQSFKWMEGRTKHCQRTEYSRYIINHVKEYVYSLNWGYVLDRLPGSVQDGIFTPGATYEGATSRGQKLVVLSHQVPEALGTIMGTYYAPMVCDQSMVLDAWGRNKNVVRIVGVPKSYKTARIVAPEELQRQMKARKVFDLIDRILPEGIDLHNQQKNVELAWSASRSGLGATLDMSSASDCVSESLVRELFPQEVVKVFDTLTPQWYTTDKRNFKRLQQYSTMGNSLTFAIESIVFWAICSSATDLYFQFTGTPQDFPVSVYGDDCIVPTKSANLCVDWLTSLGFLINEAKSFTGTLKYRESCGSEWYNGIDVSTLYWPRKILKGTYDKGKVTLSSTVHKDAYSGEEWDSTSVLVDLQHKLYSVCVPASRFVEDLILAAHPQMTYSEYGSSYGDLWGPEDTSQIVWAPMRSDLHVWDRAADAPEAMQRHLRYVRRTVYRGQLNDQYAKRVIRQAQYTEFLMHGPSYSSELDRLLGISDRVASPEREWLLPQSEWKLRRI